MVERSIPLFAGADQLAIATDLFHRRRALDYLRSLAPEVAELVIDGDVITPRILELEI